MIVVVLSASVLYLVVPVHASTETIAVSNPSYSSHVTLGNPVDVSFIVSWSGVPLDSNTGAYYITAGVVDSHNYWVDGTKVSSNPDVCQGNTRFYTQPNWAACSIAHPGTDGYVALDFSLDISQVGQYSYKVGAQIFDYNYACPPLPFYPYAAGATGLCRGPYDESSPFTINIIDAFKLTVKVPNTVPVTLDGVQQGAGTLNLTLHPHTHAISVPNIVQLNSTSRLEFNCWSDGSTQLSRKFDLENDTEMAASYVTQYYVSATGESTLDSGWYDSGTVVKFSVNQTQPWNSYRVVVGGFDGWYSNGRLISKSKTASLAVDGPVNLNVEWNYFPYVPPIILIIVATVGVAREAGERRRMEEELLKSKRLAAVGEAAAMIGHDLRNPLQATTTTLYLAKQLLESGTVEEKNKAVGLLDELDDQVHYMDKIVSDLQAYAGPVDAELIETNLPELIREIVSRVKIPGNVKVSNPIQGEPPKAIANPVLLRRILVNLILNAVQAMPNGGKLTITASSTQDSAVIAVQDTGTGIPSENLKKLFNPFFTTKAQGQGLGLAVCKRLVEAQDGEIMVRSELGKGSTFTIKLRTKKTERTN